MIRAWAVILQNFKQPVPIGNGESAFQYPIFRTIKEAKNYRKAHSYMTRARIVRCQIRIEGVKARG